MIVKIQDIAFQSKMAVLSESGQNIVEHTILSSTGTAKSLRFFYSFRGTFKFIPYTLHSSSSSKTTVLAKFLDHFVDIKWTTTSSQRIKCLYR